MKRRTSLLLATSLLILACILVITRRPPTPEADPVTKRPNPVEQRVSRVTEFPRPDRLEKESEPGLLEHWRERISEQVVRVDPDQAQAVLYLAEELELAIQHGLDPNGEDAQVYAEAMEVLLTSSE